jgi:hypothetical protein
MTRKLAKPRASAKSDGCRIRQEKKSAVGGLAAVMQNVQASLDGGKAAKTLNILTDVSVSTCEKMLAGNRLPNSEMLAALCQTRLVIETVLALTQGSSDPVVKDVHKAVRRLQLERELAHLDAGDQ